MSLHSLVQLPKHRHPSLLRLWCCSRNGGLESAAKKLIRALGGFLLIGKECNHPAASALFWLQKVSDAYSQRKREPYSRRFAIRGINGGRAVPFLAEETSLAVFVLPAMEM